MMKKHICTFLWTLISTAAIAQVEGGVKVANNNARLILDEVLNLNIVSDDLNDFVFDEVDEFDNGITQLAATTFAVDASVAWKVNFSADNDAFQTSSGAEMPLSVMSLAKSGESLQELTSNASDNVLTTGSRGNDLTEGNTFSVDYKANPGYEYEPGTYSVGIVFTISAQ